MSLKTIIGYWNTLSKKYSKPSNPEFSTRFCNTRLWWVDSNQQLMQENRDMKRRLIEWDRNSLIGKAGVVGTQQSKLGINLLLPSARHAYSHFLESRASASIRVTQEDKCQNHKYCSLSPSFPKLLLLKMMSDGVGHPSGQSRGQPGAAVLAVPPAVSARGKAVQRRQKEPALTGTAQQQLKH